MFIKINKDNKIIFRCNINKQPNEQDTFLVDSVPQAEAGKILCFNPETREFYQEDIPDYVEQQEKAMIQKEFEELEKEDVSILMDGLRILLEEHKSDREDWQAWLKNYHTKKNRREELKKRI